MNIISNRLPVGVKIEYNKSEAEPRNFDKLLLWETFPAEDNEQLEKRVFQAEKIMKKNSFLQVDIILYIGNIKTASTDLKSNIEPLKNPRIIVRINISSVMFTHLQARKTSFKT